MSTVRGADCSARSTNLTDPIIQVEGLGDDVSFVVASPLLKEVRARAELVAGVNVPVLVLGETGTGKDVIVRPARKPCSPLAVF
ncbi:MAG TPA: sigma 54-interacting transcriptional regulator [Terriglobia bacterium]|nr:sigma 54-interacting transcriptional regulator [Terriglobia bacterium]